MNIWTVASLVFILNLPFGYWRANERKLSTRWFLSIHLPVPIVVALRIFSGLGWHFMTFPIMISAFFGGQFAGAWIYRMLKAREGYRVSSCLVWDLVGQNLKRRQF